MEKKGFDPDIQTPPPSSALKTWDKGRGNWSKRENKHPQEFVDQTLRPAKGRLWRGEEGGDERKRKVQKKHSAKSCRANTSSLKKTHRQKRPLREGEGGGREPKKEVTFVHRAGSGPKRGKKKGKKTFFGND